MKIQIGGVALLLLLAAAGCGAMQSDEGSVEAQARGGGEYGAAAREASARAVGGYVGEIETRGTVVDAVAFLLRGDAQSRDPSGGVLALQTPDGLFLVLPPGVSSSDGTALDPDPVEEEQLDFDLGSLSVGERVRVSGEIYRRGGLQGIEVESIERE